MQPAVGESPAQGVSLEGYALVFDAVYTPLQTQLLKVRPRPQKGVGRLFVPRTDLLNI